MENWDDRDCQMVQVRTDTPENARTSATEVHQVTVVENLTRSENEQSLKTDKQCQTATAGALSLCSAHQQTRHRLQYLYCSRFFLPVVLQLLSQRELICHKFAGVAASAFPLNKI